MSGLGIHKGSISRTVKPDLRGYGHSNYRSAVRIAWRDLAGPPVPSRWPAMSNPQVSRSAGTVDRLGVEANRADSVGTLWIMLDARGSHDERYDESRLGRQ